MKTFFVKMQGLGNDFIVLDARKSPVTLGESGIRALCDRRLGIGADMVIVIENPRNVADADVFMGIFNFDGSEVGACGNATRCVAGLLMQESGKTVLVIETQAGRLVAEKASDGQVSVDMGAARLEWQQIPLSQSKNTEIFEIDGVSVPSAVAVNMGNPHAVFFVDDVAAVDLEGLGQQVENHPLFPERTNVEFVQVLTPDHLRMRVWERGVGVTPACGTGACASVVAAIRRGLVAGRQARITLDGGDLHIHWREDDGHVVMTGPWAEVYRGEIAL